MDKKNGNGKKTTAKTSAKISTNSNIGKSLNNDKSENNSSINNNNNICNNYMNTKNELLERKEKNKEDFETYLTKEKLHLVACKLTWNCDKKHFTKGKGIRWPDGSDPVTFQKFEKWLIDKKINYDEIYVNYDIRDTNIALFDFDGLHHTLHYIREKYVTIGQTYNQKGNNKGLHSFLRNNLFIKAQKINDNTAIADEPTDFIPDNLWMKPMDFVKLRNNLEDLYEIPDDELKKNFPIIYDKCTSKKKIYMPDNSKISECNNKEIVEMVNDCITDEMADNGADWSKIIAALKGLELKDVARNFSKRSDKHTEEIFDEKWKNSNILNIGTLYNYAKQGNKNKFIEIKNKYNENSVNARLLLADTELAELFMAGNDDIFYTEKKGDEGIYMYNEKKKIWEKIIKNSNNIQLPIKRKLVRYFEYLGNKIADEFKNIECKDIDNCKKTKPCGCEEKKERAINQAANVNDNRLNCKKQCVLESIEKGVKNIIKENPVDIKLDFNPYLFCWNNATYDISKKEFVERTKEDYITHTNGYDYKKKNIDLEKIDKLLDTIFPNPDIKKSYLSYLNTGLTRIKPQKFACSNGTGGNGKGLLGKLMMKTLGTYGAYLANTLITKTLDPSKPAPEAASLKNVRYGIFQELPENKKLDGSNIKNLTGENIIKARMLYQNECDVLIIATFMAECNERLKIKGTGDDPAWARRYIDYLFESSFVDKDDPKIDNKKIFARNTEYSENDDFTEELKIDFFHYLIEYREEEIFIPDCVKERSKEYLRNTNGILTFFEENYEKIEGEYGPLDYISLKNVCDSYRMSFEYKSLDKEDKQEVNVSYMKKKLINYYGDNYKEMYQPSKEGKQIKVRNIILGYREIEED